MESAKTNKQVVALCAVSLLAGIALGFFCKPQPPAAKEEKPVSAPVAKKAKAGDSGSEASLRGLRRRVRELEKALADAGKAKAPEKKEEEEKLDDRFPFRFDRGGFRGPSVADMRKFAEDFRKRDPEAYANMTNRMAQGLARRQERAMSRLDVLASVDVSKMTEKQREVHETYQNLLARQMELQNILNPQNADVSDDDRQAALDEMHKLHRDVRKYADEERKILLAQTGMELGIGAKETASFVEVIESVYDVTEGHHRFGGRGGRGGPPPPRR